MQTLNFQILNSKNAKNIANNGNLSSKNKNSLNKTFDSSSNFKKLLLSKTKNYSDEKKSNISNFSQKKLNSNLQETKFESSSINQTENREVKNSKLKEKNSQVEQENSQNQQKSKKISEKSSNNLEENQKLNQKTENLQENFTLEEQSVFNQNFQEEFVYSDGFSGVQINSLQNQNQEVLELNSQQISYLMSKETSFQNDFDALIENASEYLPKTNKEILETAQNLSVEEPEEFLKKADFALENSVENLNSQSLASFESENNSQKDFSDFQKSQSQENATFNSLKSQNSFSISFNDSFSGTNQVLNVKDERSFEEKLKALEQNLESNSELSKKNSLSFTVNFEQSVQNITSQNAQNAAAQGSSFQEMFAQTLNNHVGDFVKVGTIVLKNNNQGEINMNLKPESLGNVKLFLQVSDKVITGQITVHSKEAMEAFKQNLEGIKQAFVANGFEEANINLVLADSGGFAGNFNQQANQNQQQNQQFVGNKVYGDYAYDNSSESLSKSKYYEQKDSFKVNVVA